MVMAITADDYFTLEAGELRESGRPPATGGYRGGARAHQGCKRSKLQRTAALDTHRAAKLAPGMRPYAAASALA